MADLAQLAKDLTELEVGKKLSVQGRVEIIIEGIDSNIKYDGNINITRQGKKAYTISSPDRKSLNLAVSPQEGWKEVSGYLTVNTKYGKSGTRRINIYPID